MDKRTDIFALKKFNEKVKPIDKRCPCCVNYTERHAVADPHRHDSGCVYEGVHHDDIPHPRSLPRLKKGTLVKQAKFSQEEGSTRSILAIVVQRIPYTESQNAHNPTYGPVYKVKCVSTGEYSNEFRTDMLTPDEAEQVRAYVERRAEQAQEREANHG